MRTVEHRAPLANHKLFRTADLDEARWEVGRVFCPHRLELISGHGALDAMQNAVRLDQLGLSYLSYGGEVRITPGELKTFFLVQIPLRGSAEISQGRVSIVSTPARASVLSATEAIDMRWSADNPQLIVRIERSALERHLATLTGQSVKRPLRFALGMELGKPAVRSWLRLVALMREELEHAGGLVHHRATTAALEELLMTGLLVAQPSNYSRSLQLEPQPVCPRVVRRAVDLMHASLSDPPTVAQLARDTGVSARALQGGFRRHLGTTPSTYLRGLRLERAHQDLLAASPADGASVTEISLRWGFAHHGRFAASYRQRYGVSPSQTLHE